MKFVVGLICIVVTSLCGHLSQSEASEVLVAANPTSIKYGLTKILQIRCSLQHTQAGDDSVHDKADRYAVTVNSISITRDEKCTIASLSDQHPAVASSDVDKLTVHGDLTSSGDSSYLQLTWTNPGINQAGIYTCTINATGSLGQNVLYTYNKYICYQRPNEEDILNYIIELEDRLSQTQIAVEECKNNLKIELQDVRNALNNSQSNLQGQVNTLKSQDITTSETLQRLETGASTLRTDLTAVENHIDSYVSEEGLINFGSSNNFQPAGEYNTKQRIVYVKFTKTFPKLPTVICNLQAMDADKGTNTRFRYYVRDLTTEGFNLHCETWWNTYLRGIDVKWTASLP